jgi:hypothetical protein
MIGTNRWPHQKPEAGKDFDSTVKALTFAI